MPEYYIAHHGIKGQKWGVRRYQNRDGSYTAEGRARYLKAGGNAKKYDRAAIKDYDKAFNKYTTRYGNIDDNRHWKNLNNVNMKVKKAMTQTKEYKQMAALDQYMQNLQRQAPGAFILDPRSQQLYDTVADNYERRFTKVSNQFLDDIAGACLRDMGYQDDSLGRSYMKRTSAFKRFMS